MTRYQLTKTRIFAGAYEGVVRSKEVDRQPELGAYLGDRPVGRLTIAAVDGAERSWNLRVELPADILTDGVQTFLIVDTETGATLDSFAILTGEPVADDLRGEIDLLRAELDMLKKAFRRHCVETT